MSLLCILLHSRGVLKRKRRYLIYYVTSLLGGQILPPSKIILFLGLWISLGVTTAGVHSVVVSFLDSFVLLSVLLSVSVNGVGDDCEHEGEGCLLG